MKAFFIPLNLFFNLSRLNTKKRPICSINTLANKNINNFFTKRGYTSLTHIRKVHSTIIPREKNIFNLSSLTYLNVFKLACRTFISNLSSKDIALNIALRIILCGIIYFWVIYLNWSVLVLALVRIFILQIILLFVFYLFNEKIVFFFHNLTVKDLIYITTYSMILFSVMLIFFSIFINVSNHILELAIVFLTPGLNGSIVWMDISQLLNPTTPPASSGNNVGGCGNGGGGGGGSGGNSGILPLGGHGTNHSNHYNTEVNTAPTYPAAGGGNNPAVVAQYGQSMPCSFPIYNPAGGNQPHASELANILDEARLYNKQYRLTKSVLSEDYHRMLKTYLEVARPMLHYEVYVNCEPRRPAYWKINNTKILTDGLRYAP